VRPQVALGDPVHTTKIFFIIFVDAIFTTLFERPFTNVFDVIGATSANHCVCRVCHAG
jgi:hypothetical protein